MVDTSCFARSGQRQRVSLVEVRARCTFFTVELPVSSQFCNLRSSILLISVFLNVSVFSYDYFRISFILSMWLFFLALQLSIVYIYKLWSSVLYTVWRVTVIEACDKYNIVKIVTWELLGISKTQGLFCLIVSKTTICVFF